MAPPAASATMRAMLLHSSPNTAVILGTLGVCLIFLELNRPGRVLPGAAGLLLVLLAGFALSGRPVQLGALLLVLAAAVVSLLNLLVEAPFWVLAGATVGLCVGLRFLVVAGADARVSVPVATGCGLVLGAAGSVLSRVALRARRAKRVN